MTLSTAAQVSLAIEGDLDEVVGRRLVEEAGGRVLRVYGKTGKDRLRRQAGAYNEAARRASWFLLVDLDDDECPATLRREWIAGESSGLCFRVAVAEVESWLLADRDRLAAFLAVSVARVPPSPDDIPDPKQAVLALAARSRRRSVRDAITPRPAARVGPLYTGTLSEFASEYWSPAEAALASPSLASCRRRLAEILAR